MRSHDLERVPLHGRFRAALPIIVLALATLAVSLYVFDPAPPRRITLASGPEFGLYHRYAQRYAELLRRQGVTVREQMTAGAADNLRLLSDPGSKVDVAFLQGGVAPADSDRIVMIASLYYEPLWIFYAGTPELSRVTQLRGKRIAIGAPGSGTLALASQVLAANGLAVDERAADATALVQLAGEQALAALDDATVDAAIFVGGAQTPLIRRALSDPKLRLMSLARADAYQRRLSFVSKLVLPPGTIDLAHDVPAEKVDLLATKAMLVARADIHPALVNLLFDAAREIHGGQGYFESPGEFPNTAPVDLPVSPYADQHKKFGSSFLYSYLPFWLAAVVERVIILVLPLAAVLVPTVTLVPHLLAWRVHSRIYRWYEELTSIERAMHGRKGDVSVEQWLRDVARIERAVESANTPAKYASEVYTLRQHIDFVRRALLARIQRGTPESSAGDATRAG
jgi:TRAP transporter TAXI family solute receptor